MAELGAACKVGDAAADLSVGIAQDHIEAHLVGIETVWRAIEAERAAKGGLAAAQRCLLDVMDAQNGNVLRGGEPIGVGVYSLERYVVRCGPVAVDIGKGDGLTGLDDGKYVLVGEQHLARFVVAGNTDGGVLDRRVGARVLMLAPKLI